MLWERSERDFRTHPAAASIAAGLAVTLHDLLAVDAGEARRTGAGVAALAGVHAPGPVDAGLVVCAVVQVCENKGAAASASSPPYVIFAVASLAADENGYTPWSQKMPPQPSLQVHCHGSLQVPCLQVGWGVHTSQKSPCQPFLHLFTCSTTKPFNPQSHAGELKRQQTQIYLPSN